MFPAVTWSESWTFFGGRWLEGNPAIIGPRTHAFWLGSVIFDGARSFEGTAPDLDLHLARANRSAAVLGLEPMVSVAQWRELALDGLKKYAAGTAVYLRPMYWGEVGGPLAINADPAQTRWCLCLYAMPMPDHGGSLTLSPYRRPTPECAPTDAKAVCLYPNNARAFVEAAGRGFDNPVLRDLIGNVAETGSSNLFLVKDGVVTTPVANGTFLAGITRARVLGLLRGAGFEVRETTVRFADLLAADEIFTTGNYGKVQAMTRIEDRVLPIGPVARRARELYWDFAHSHKI